MSTQQLDILLKVRSDVEGLRKAQEEFTRTKSVINQLTSSLSGGVGLGIGAMFVQQVMGPLRQIITGPMGLIELGSRVADLSAQVNLSATSWQVYATAAKEVGASEEILRPMFVKLATTLNEAAKGTESASEKFRALGLDAADLARVPVEEQLARIARAMVQADDQAVAYAATVDLLGTKSSPQLMAMLRQLGDEGWGYFRDRVIEANGVLNDDAVQSLDAAGDALARLQNKVRAAAGNTVAFISDINLGTAATVIGVGSLGLALARLGPQASAFGSLFVESARTGFDTLPQLLEAAVGPQMGGIGARLGKALASPMGAAIVVAVGAALIHLWQDAEIQRILNRYRGADASQDNLSRLQSAVQNARSDAELAQIQSSIRAERERLEGLQRERDAIPDEANMGGAAAARAIVGGADLIAQQERRQELDLQLATLQNIQRLESTAAAKGKDFIEKNQTDDRVAAEQAAAAEIARIQEATFELTQQKQEMLLLRGLEARSLSLAAFEAEHRRMLQAALEHELSKIELTDKTEKQKVAERAKVHEQHAIQLIKLDTEVAAKKKAAADEQIRAIKDKERALDEAYRKERTALDESIRMESERLKDLDGRTDADSIRVRTATEDRRVRLIERAVALTNQYADALTALGVPTAGKFEAVDSTPPVAARPTPTRIASAQVAVDGDAQYGGRGGLDDASLHFQGPSEGALGGMLQIIAQAGTIGDQIAQQFQAIAATVSGSLSSAFQGLIYGTMTWRDAINSVGLAIGQSVVRAITDMAAQWLVTRTLMLARSIFFDQAEVASHATAEGEKATATATGAAVRTSTRGAEAGADTALTGAQVAAHGAGESAKTGWTVFGALKRGAIRFAETIYHGLQVAFRVAAHFAGEAMMTAVTIAQVAIRLPVILMETIAKIITAGAGALAALSSIPVVGPFLGIAAMAAVVAAGIGLVSKMSKGFYDGGYTGDGHPREVAGVVHRGEYVVPADAVDQIGLARLNALTRGGGIDYSQGTSLPDRRSVAGASAGASGSSSVNIAMVSSENEYRNFKQQADGRIARLERHLRLS